MVQGILYLRTTRVTRVSVLFCLGHQADLLFGWRYGGEPDKFLIWVAAVSPSIIRLSSPYMEITLKILVSTLPPEKEESARRVHLPFRNFVF